MPATSAGLLLYRIEHGELEVLLGHMGGPFWVRKDEGAWSIPKGEYLPGEDPLVAARREFTEEMGIPPPDGEPIPLGEVKQPSGKVIRAWCLRGDFDTARLRSNTFPLEWPPRSGRIQAFPEIDRAAWFSIDAARRKLVRGQIPLLDRMLERVGW